MYYPPHHDGTPLSMEAATHLKSQPEIAGSPASPVRPSAAPSTIRTVPPSPPLSFTEALRVDLAEDPARPYHDILHGSPKALLDNVKAENEHVESFEEHTANPEDECGYKGSSVGSPGTALRHGGAGSGRSPSKIRSRSHSPQKQRFCTIAKSPHQAPVVKDQDAADSMWYSTTEDDIDEDDSYERNAPETPTPMSREQRIQAYTPLGVPPPLFSVEHERKQHSGDSVQKTISPEGQPTHTLHHKHALPHPSPCERNFKPHLRDMVSAARIRERFPAAIEEQTTAPIKTTPPQRFTHVSSSARSNASGGTAESRRSVFSTLGRDEMERKKALVEVDEGPFARAVSMQDLDARRRQVSGNSEDAEEGGECGSRKRMWRTGCGMSERCCVM